MWFVYYDENEGCGFESLVSAFEFNCFPGIDSRLSERGGGGIFCPRRMISRVCVCVRLGGGGAKQDLRRSMKAQHCRMY